VIKRKMKLSRWLMTINVINHWARMITLPRQRLSSSKYNKMVNEVDIKLALDDLKSQKSSNYSATFKKI